MYFLTPILTYFEKIKILLLQVAFLNYLTHKYDICIKKDENRKKVYSILTLGSNSYLKMHEQNRFFLKIKFTAP
jgi:hypothetical protein